MAVRRASGVAAGTIIASLVASVIVGAPVRGAPAPIVALADGDAYVSSKRPNKNFGAASLLSVREGSAGSPTTFRSYLSFALSGIDGPVTSVRLRLVVTESSVDGGSVFAITAPWTEGGITYANAPPPGPTPLGAIGPVSAGTTIEVELGAAVTGDGRYAFAIRSASTDRAGYASSETANPPQLIVTTAAAPTGSPVADFSAAPTSGPAPLTVAFHDTSTNGPTAWSWDFGDDGSIDSTARDPSFTFGAPGTFDVRLRVTNAFGGNEVVKPGFVTVT